MAKSLVLVFFLLAAGLTFSAMELSAEQARRLSLEAIFSPDSAQRIEFDGTPLTGLTWQPDGNHFLQPDKSSVSSSSRLEVDTKTGDSQPFEAPSRLSEEIAAIPENEREVSPDGKHVSFVRHNNLFVVEIESGQELALTRDGSADLLHGRLDWVYQEELYGRGNFKAHWWSQDSEHLAFLRLDESPVREFTVVDHRTTPLVTEITTYPKAGAPNPKVALGVVPVGGGEIVWVDDSRYREHDHLIVRVGWTPDGRNVVYQVQDREQTWMDLNLADPKSGSTQTLLRETSPAFVDVDLSGMPHWLDDGSFLWLSGRSGYHHIYQFEPDGSLRQQITDGEWEVSQLHGIDEASGWLYFTSTEHAPTERHLYRARLESGTRERLSDRAGTHVVSFDPTLRFYFDTWSDIQTPPQVSLHRSDGTQLRVLSENPVPELSEIELGQIEFHTVQTPDGFELEALSIKPPDFDPNKKYPVIQYNYGGPHAPIVVDRWGGKRGIWHHFLAQEGFVVWMCDNRSASGKGIKPTWQAYGRLGEVELRDIEHCLDWLEQQPWVDSSRLGIWGGSYGGFMAIYALTHTDRFKAAVAWAPVTDWRLYDSIYTERYMKTPQDNPDGYDATSVIQAAEDLNGRLLLAHGTIDDNVHFQNSIQLIEALQKAGKEFDLMVYPGSRHGISVPEQQFHFYSLMTSFFRENL